MKISFERPDTIKPNMLVGALIHQDYYVQLLRYCDQFFDLHMLNKHLREVPLRDCAYMPITDNPNVIRKLQIGIKVRMLVTEICYNRTMNILVARVHLKNNYTMSEIPHIIIASNPKIPDQMAMTLLDGSFSVGEVYHRDLTREPIVLRGRIGVIIHKSKSQKSKKNKKPKIPEDPPQQRLPRKRGVHYNLMIEQTEPVPEPDEIHQSHEPRTRSRTRGSRPQENARMLQTMNMQQGEDINVVFSEEADNDLSKYFMDDPLPPHRHYQPQPQPQPQPQSQPQQQLYQQPQHHKHHDIVFEHSNHVVTRPEALHSVEKPLRPSKMYPTEYQEPHHEITNPEPEEPEFYKGYPLKKGPRGGKFIIKDGKKVYVSESMIANHGKKSANFGSNKVVYRVNILE